jgi:hypothetical protein
MIAITRTLGILRTESAAYEDLGGQGTDPQTLYRPVRTPMLNDGRWHYWMTPGEDYDITRDGHGWVVTCRSWPCNGHTYRLATAEFAMASALPIDEGDRYAELSPGQRYALRSGAAFTWSLVEI